MPSAILTRVSLQVLYLEKIASPYSANTLREMLGPLVARGQDDYAPRARKTLDIRGAYPVLDNATARQTEIRAGGSKVIDITLPVAADDFEEPGWDECEVMLCRCASAAEITGLSAFGCRRWTKLIVNLGPGTLTLHEQNTSSIADNRLIATTELAARAAAWVVRDFESARWRATRGEILNTTPSGDGFYYTNEDGELRILGF